MILKICVLRKIFLNSSNEEYDFLDNLWDNVIKC